MAEIDLEADGRAEGERDGAFPTPDDVRRSLAASPKPTTPQEYDVYLADFWLHRYIPVGSVIVFHAMDEDGMVDNGEAAVLVSRYQSDRDGIWLTVSVLGAEQEKAKKYLTAFFKGGRRRIHICYPDASSSCPLAEEKGLHLYKFIWYPPGDFDVAWLSNAARKKVKEGPKMAHQAAEEAGPRKTDRGKGKGLSDTERRLAALRGDRRRVTFTDDSGPAYLEPRADGEQDGYGGGILRKQGGLRPALEPPPPLRDKVKEEVVDLTAKPSRSRSPQRSRKRQTVGNALASAAAAQQRGEVKKERKSRERRSRERSRSRRTRSRKRRRRRSSSPDESSGESSRSSDSSSLLPPLKRKSQKQPGSVLRMLEQQAFDFLSQDGIVSGEDPSVELGSRPKLFTYYQLGLRPSLDPKSRDSKELALLSKALDTLREGKLDVLADMLAARLIAVDTATRQGWSTARHLEVYDPEEGGTAPAHILLAAQKHGKQIERAGGKGSWSRQTWGGDWIPEKGRNKNKDAKGKNKKGKGKNKGAKAWQAWNPEGKEKNDKKPGETG
eukprot:s3055_g6.t1